MATLNSPGISVTVVDESFYVPAATGTIPLIFVSSAENKSNGSGTGIAPGTLKSNAGQVYLLTSRKDLADTFGTPLFYTDSQGNPINGGEQNEYGLQAAYSLLGVTSRAYVARADINLSELTQTSTPPVSPVANGTKWLQTSNSLYGINEWNPTTLKFTNKTPLIIDDSNMDLYSAGGVPRDSFGHAGDYAMYITGSANVGQDGISLWFKTSSSQDAWTIVKHGFDGGKRLTITPHYQYPTYNETTPVGSVWIKTTTPGLGANWMIKSYNSSSQSYTSVASPIYDSSVSALFALDQYGGGKNIPVGSVFVESNFNHGTNTDYKAQFKIWSRISTGTTSITVGTTVSKVSSTSTFTIRETLANNKNWSSTATITVAGSTTTAVAQQIATAIGASNLVNVRASYDSMNNKMTISHALGGDIEIADGTNNPLGNGFLNFEPFDTMTKVGVKNLFTAPSADNFDFIITNWAPLIYLAQTDTPSTSPVDGTLWYDVNLSSDIMVNDGQRWVGYKVVFPDSDPAGPYIGSTAPMQQSTGAPLVSGDIWISTADIERYGKDIYVYDATLVINDPMTGWVLSDVADSTSPEGWLFHDARWSTTGGDGLSTMFDPANIADLLHSNYVDPDAPNPLLYPRGLRLFNTRRSGFNVKKYHKGYIDINANNGQNLAYQNEVMNGEIPYFADRWVTAVSNNQDGSGKFGRYAQRGVVVEAFKELVNTSTAIRDAETLIYSLIACPGYPELMQDMVALNTDIGQLAMVVGDTPFRLKPDATTLSHWGENTALTYDNGEEGAVTRNEYLAMYYPSGYTTDNNGNYIVVPPSHMMLRTIINSDNKSYPWFAPAGLRRGVIDNATSVGYINSQTGEFTTASLYQGIRDVLQDPSGLVNINPITTIPGAGLVAYGQKTRSPVISALDRVNVVRLVCYLRRQLAIISKPYLFEPNDAQTRREIKASMDSFLVNLVNQRALYDFIVVCDTSNNTTARIDRSELWVDIAIEPVKAVEFIYIPLRVLNTGAIAARGK
jgi:hypothetical protein